MVSPALELSKMLCHLISFEPQAASQIPRLRRNLLKLLGVREFAAEATFQSIGASVWVRDVICEFCGHCYDVDMCGDDWWCECCETPYDADVLEYQLVRKVQRHAQSLQAQDLQCAKCSLVQRNNLTLKCERCIGSFELRVPQTASWLTACRRVAEQHGMSWLLEEIGW